MNFNFIGTIMAIECRDEESWWFDNVCKDGDGDFKGYKIIDADTDAMSDAVSL